MVAVHGLGPNLGRANSIQWSAGVRAKRGTDLVEAVYPNLLLSGDPLGHLPYPDRHVAVG